MNLALSRPMLVFSAFALRFVLLPTLGLIACFDPWQPVDVEADLRNLGRELPILCFRIRESAPPPAPRLVSEMKKPVDTRALISEAAKKHRVPAAFVKSIVAAESNFNCDAISSKGAIGLMQLMPQTAEEYGADPRIPEQNVDAGTRYLRVLMDRYSRRSNSLKRVIAAYNAGPGTVDRYRGVPPFRETRAYVVRVLSFLRRYERERG
jgi:soluble lytic murein transglycosylase-like protein